MVVGGSHVCRGPSRGGVKSLRWGGDSFDLRAREWWCVGGCAACACVWACMVTVAEVCVLCTPRRMQATWQFMYSTLIYKLCDNI